MRIRWLAAATVGLLIAASTGCTATKKTDQPGIGSTSLIEHGLEGKIYLLPNTTRQLPEFSKLRPEGTIYAATLNVPPTNWKAGFPGITDRFDLLAIVAAAGALAGDRCRGDLAAQR